MVIIFLMKQIQIITIRRIITNSHGLFKNVNNDILYKKKSFFR